MKLYLVQNIDDFNDEIKYSSSPNPLNYMQVYTEQGFIEKAIKENEYEHEEMDFPLQDIKTVQEAYDYLKDTYFIKEKEV